MFETIVYMIDVIFVNSYVVVFITYTQMNFECTILWCTRIHMCSYINYIDMILYL